MPPDPDVHVGVCAVVHSPGNVMGGKGLLMVQRGGVGKFASDGRGSWSVPGGWLDFGETPKEAAVREVAEETGVVVEAAMEMGFVNAYSEVTHAQIVTLFIGCLYLSGQPRITEPDKCPAVEWVPPVALKQLTLFAPLNAWLAMGRKL